MEDRAQHLSFENGTRTSITWQCNGIKIGHAISRFSECTSISSSNQNDVVRLHFGLKGDYSFSHKQLNKSFDLVGGHHNIMYSNGFDMTVKNKTPEIETFGIQFPKELFIEFTGNANDTLKWFAENIMKGNSVLLSNNWGPLTPSIEQVIQQVIDCKYPGDLKTLFLLSKSIELLVLSAETCIAQKNKKGTLLKTKADKEKIIAVRDLINERLHCPPNLTEIAKTVGLNEYKLKRGFKETFNNTVFGYLTDQRLNLAHRYLQNREKTVAEVAYEMGYTSPQYFNNAFKHKFGFTPYSVRNNP